MEEVDVFGTKTSKDTFFVSLIMMRIYLSLKKVFDLVFSILAVILLLPIMVILAIAIKLDSKGPIFYKGIRTGQFNKKFKMLKFRTMVQNAEKIGSGVTAKNDSRITRVGKYLRQYKLDELPQLFNVLKGEMSFVGPRPELPQYTDKYTPKELCILDVKPGITDYSSLEFINLGEQVGNEENNHIKIAEEQILPRKNALRVKYVENRCIRTDLSILIETLLKIIHIK